MHTFSLIEQQIIEMFITVVEKKDAYTAGHSKRVALYSIKIAEKFGCNVSDQRLIYQAGLLHDIGKILTPESILLKPRKFNHHEYEIIKNHSVDGENILSFISSFKPYIPLVRHHHERYDGNGYPDGLKGDAIPLLSRILSIADAFDAMTTNRIYQPRKTIIDAMDELKKYSGTQFDPEVLSVALSVFQSSQESDLAHQEPKDYIQEERFAYFYKDALTSVYTGEYLSYFLHHNDKNLRFQCCYFIQLHHMHHYNQHFGWKAGDILLQKVAFRLKVLLCSSFIFRIFGDDFVVLKPLHVEVDEKEIIQKIGVGFDGISVSFKHFALKDFPIAKWENFENYLIHFQALAINDSYY